MSNETEIYFLNYYNYISQNSLYQYDNIGLFDTWQDSNPSQGGKSGYYSMYMCSSPYMNHVCTDSYTTMEMSILAHGIRVNRSIFQYPGERNHPNYCTTLESCPPSTIYLQLSPNQLVNPVPHAEKLGPPWSSLGQSLSSSQNLEKANAPCGIIFLSIHPSRINTSVLAVCALAYT